MYMNMGRAGRRHVSSVRGRRRPSEFRHQGGQRSGEDAPRTAVLAAALAHSVPLGMSTGGETRASQRVRGRGGRAFAVDRLLHGGDEISAINERIDTGPSCPWPFVNNAPG